MPKGVQEPVDIRLYRGGKRNSVTGCLEWQGSVSGIKWNGRPHAVSRVAWTLEYGEIPEGYFLCHRCDNPPCFELSHLFLGTPQDNHDDMVAKGRHNFPKPGLLSTRRKLAEQDILRIRKLYATGRYTHRSLAGLYDLHFTNIGMIVNGRRFRDVDTYSKIDGVVKRHKY